MGYIKILKRNHWTSWIIISGVGLTILMALLIFAATNQLPLGSMYYLIVAVCIVLAFICLFGVVKGMNIHRLIVGLIDQENELDNQIESKGV